MSEQECVPIDEKKEGAHWLSDGGESLPSVFAKWEPPTKYLLGYWHFFGRPRINSEAAHDLGYRYLRPVLTPEQEDALHAEIDEMAAALISANEGLLEAWKETGEARREIERLRQRITELTTALDERASETQERDWRVL